MDNQLQEKRRKLFWHLKQLRGKRKVLAALIAGLVVAVSIAAVSIAVVFTRPEPEDIAIIELRGELVSGGGSILFTTTGEIERSFEKAKMDKNIKAVVLAVDSPGGTAAASYEMYSLVKSFDKPVVAFARGTAGSGSYLVSLGADKIVAHPFSVIGSVGAYILLEKAVPVEPKDAEEIEAISSGKFKNLWSDGVLDEDERQFLNMKVEEAAEAFREIVYKESGIEKREDVEEDIEDPFYVFLEGGWFNGEKALELGLVDEVGNMEDAVKLACELASIKYEKSKLIKIEPPPPGTFEAMLYETPSYQDNEGLPIYLK
jgi:protease-4